MKKLLLILTLFLVTLNLSALSSSDFINKKNNHTKNGGDKPKKKDTVKLQFNLNGFTNKLEETLKPGEYNLSFIGYFDEGLYTVNIKKKETITLIEPLQNEKVTGEDEFKEQMEAEKDTFKFDFDFSMKKRSKFELTVQINNKSDGKLFKEIKVIYTSKNNMKWVTSLGVASAFLSNRDTYRTVKQGETDVFKVERDGSNQILQVIPLMQFSFINAEKDSAIVPTAGIGFDTENISAFFGGSFYVGQNVFITGGFALHKQKRLNNLYKESQELSESIDESILNKEYYRFNPFVSITYRLSNNIFKK